MSEPERYPYVPKDPALGEAGFRPILPLLLNSPQGSAETSGLLDTGATVNVMPYSLELDLVMNGNDRQRLLI
jgi:hypothetical protein